MRVFRDFLSNQWGDSIVNTAAGSTGIMTYTDTLPVSINGVPLQLGDLNIIAYINDGFQTTGNVLNGIQLHPSYVGFSTSNEVAYVDAIAPDVTGCLNGGIAHAYPKVYMQNQGSDTLQTAVITYDVNGTNTQIFNWTGNLPPAYTEIVQLDSIPFNTTGFDTVYFSVDQPNGVIDDNFKYGWANGQLFDCEFTH